MYKYLNIGTAKPTPEQRKRARHHFVDELMPDQDFNAGEFGTRGRAVIQEIFGRNKTPVVVGGSGLYVRSLIDGLFEGPGADNKFRERLEGMVKSGEVQQLIEELRRVDPVAAKNADPTKPRRIIRALEVHHVTGKAISAHHRDHKISINFTPIIFGLSWNRKSLYERIERRCDEIIASGLLKEVEALEKMNFDRSANALNTVGYAEGFGYLSGEISYEEMLRLFKQNSRRYAKRQLTWFRRDDRIQWIRMDEQRGAMEVAEEISRLFCSAL